MQSEDKWELARLISGVQCRVHHGNLRRLFSESEFEGPSLTPQQFHTILTVREQGCVTLTQLAQMLHVKTPTVSVSVDRLVEMGILTREENPADRRQVLIRISQQERSRHDASERRYLQLMVDLIEELGDDDARKWGEVCARLDEVMSRKATQ